MAPLTDEEHHTRAMLMGMEYIKPPKGLPVYFKRRADGSPDIGSMVDANTLESIFGDDYPDNQYRRDNAVKIAIDMYENKRYGKGRWVK